MCVQDHGGAQYHGCLVPWGYHEYHGGYHEYHGGYHEYHGDYLNYCGGHSVPWGYHDAHRGYHPLKFECRGDIMSIVGVFSTMGCSNNKRFPSTVLMISLHTSWYPLLYWISPTELKITPTVLMISPTVLMISPMILHTHYTGWRMDGTA